MSRTVGKKTHTIKEIWIAYATKLLKENPTWWSRYSNKCRHYRVGYYEGQKMIEVNSYPRFRKIIEQFFDRAKKAIIFEGAALNLSNNLGKICIKRIQRDFRKAKQRRINWVETKKQPKVWNEEKQVFTYAKLIYYTQDEFCRIAWIKNRQVTNETVYEFAPANRNSEGTSGFKLEFSKAESANPFLKYLYLYNPLTLKK